MFQIAYRRLLSGNVRNRGFLRYIDALSEERTGMSGANANATARSN